MSLLFLSFFGFIAVLLGFFVWSLRKPSKPLEKITLSAVQETTSRPHISFTPQIRQALAATDRAFLVQKAGNKLAKRVQRERKIITLSYLAALQGDFEKLLIDAKLIAVLSPEVVAMHEFKRIRLSMEFSLRCKWICACVLCGSTPVLQLCSLSDFVSGLTVRIETAMRELAERTAAAAQLTSSLDRSRIDSI